MSKLHKRQCGAQNAQFDEHTSDNSKQTLSKNTLHTLNELGDILRKVHRRMVFEGYTIIDGRIRKM